MIVGERVKKQLLLVELRWEIVDNSIPSFFSHRFFGEFCVQALSGNTRDLN